MVSGGYTITRPIPRAAINRGRYGSTGRLLCSKGFSRVMYRGRHGKQHTLSATLPSHLGASTKPDLFAIPVQDMGREMHN